MRDVTDKNFGVVIAFLLPGFLLLWGLSFSFPQLLTSLHKSGADDPATIGGFLYATLASLGLGLLVSALRWLVVDHVLGWITTLPEIDFSKLKDKDVFAAFGGLVENHYRYYQYYSNTLVAVLVAFGMFVWRGNRNEIGSMIPFWIVVVVVGGTLFCAARDALKKYHGRASKITS